MHWTSKQNNSYYSGTVSVQFFSATTTTTTIIPTMMANTIIKIIINITRNFIDFHIIFLSSFLVARWKSADATASSSDLLSASAKHSPRSVSFFMLPTITFWTVSTRACRSDTLSPQVRLSVRNGGWSPL